MCGVLCVGVCVSVWLVGAQIHNTDLRFVSLPLRPNPPYSTGLGVGLSGFFLSVLVFICMWWLFRTCAHVGGWVGGCVCVCVCVCVCGCLVGWSIDTQY